MSDWQDRLRPVIEFVSPNGALFTAKWIGNSYSIEKKVGIFEYPNIDGTFTQDLKSKSARYPLTFYFDGDNNDKISQQFVKEIIKTTGKWNVIHPVLGKLSLQPLSFSPDIQPVESGNITKFDSEWIDSIDITTIKSAAQLKSEIGKQVSQANNTSAGELENKADQSTFENVQAIKDVINTVSDAVSATIGTISEIQRGVQGILDETVMPLISLAGNVQELIQAPGLIIQDLETRVNSYIALAEATLGIEPEKTNRAGVNTGAAKEMCLGAIFGAFCQIGQTQELQTRNQALDLINDTVNLFNNITDNLENTQRTFVGNIIDTQYFSQSESFADYVKMLQLLISYLLSNVFNLKIEKRFVLRTPRTPIDIVINEYGQLGDNDILLDFFININNLKDTEILLLPAGKEVLVYV